MNIEDPVLGSGFLAAYSHERIYICHSRPGDPVDSFGFFGR